MFGKSRWVTVWQSELKHGYRTAEDLGNAGLIPVAQVPRYRQILKTYKFFLPRYYAGLIDPADPQCPIRRQAIPDVAELDDRGLELLPDPLHDLEHQPAPRLTHRYANRALLHLTPSCSMYCRYCFRKTLLNEGQRDLFGGELEPALVYLAEHREIEEVIFSGGDPLLSSEEALRAVLARLAEMPHLERLRFHSRVPVTLPSRVTPEWAKLAVSTRLPVVLVTHFNHPREVTAESARAIETLRAAGITVLNQSVLLRGVNDKSAILAALSKALFTNGVLPYYLHHPDPARGTGHFDVPLSEGLAIYDELRTRLAGYLVPRYVRDDVRFPFKRSLSNANEGV